ncbi:hypothetical protein SCUCBS95973_005176 [Sporothrix curviconia]|uniref:PRELI/MSF1 domain-containing protein n=1 Tax=Sporothrix curviconia TaxID=1260050 RepID=A0ABP0BUW0_9PEZI
MVLTHTTNHTYAHPFPTVTLAFFLRYCSPQLNPFAQHVLSTDTIASHVDPETGRLHTTRIHLKKSRLPKAVLKLLPTSITGGMADKASYILETSVVDMRQGWMSTESRNLNFTGVLSVVEKQLYTVALPEVLQTAPSAPSGPSTAAQAEILLQQLTSATSTTGVETTVIFRSRLGERIRERIEQGHQRYQQQIQGFKQQRQQSEQDAGTAGWFGTSWIGGLGAKGIQRSIEAIASTKTLDQLGKSREGMSLILERLRQTGIIGVLELRRRAMEGKLDVIDVA